MGSGDDGLYPRYAHWAPEHEGKQKTTARLGIVSGRSSGKRGKGRREHPIDAVHLIVRLDREGGFHLSETSLKQESN
ncbi:hypothetical protein R1flu_008569 [Riccia fluitans]|uniref:Transposase n=1 Tax=Riccia fluitans TaxID=41844 RepID=A0ABD1YD34_9MARC